jgi:hypothetical protein
MYKNAEMQRNIIFWLSLTSHQHNIGHMATFQLQLVWEDLRCHSIISDTNGHLSRTTELPSWIAFSHESEDARAINKFIWNKNI